MAQPSQASDNGLMWAMLLDRQGGGSRIGWDGLTAWRPEQGLLWAHFDISEPGPERWFEEKSGLEPQIAAALLAEDTRPRSAPSRNGLLVILRGVNRARPGEPLELVPIHLWVERNRVISAYQLLASVGQLTARDLGLRVEYYDPEENYNAVRNKWIGSGVETVE